MAGTKLLPCPFCGGEARHYAPGLIDHHIECRKCTADVAGDSEAEAIAAWNTRADDYRQAAEYWQRTYEEAFAERTCKPVEKDGVMRCPNCDYPLGIMSVPAYCAGCGAKVVGE